MRENLNSSVQIPQAQWFIRSNSIAIIKMNTIERTQELQWNRNSTQKTPISSAESNVSGQRKTRSQASP